MLLVQKYFLMPACMWENTGCITVFFRTRGWLCRVVITGFRLSPPGAWLLLLCHSHRMRCFVAVTPSQLCLHIQNLSCWVFLGAVGNLAVSPGHFLGAAACFHCHCPRSHLTGTSRLCSGEGLRDSAEWVAAVLRIIQVVCAWVLPTFRKKGYWK